MVKAPGRGNMIKKILLVATICVCPLLALEQELTTLAYHLSQLSETLEALVPQKATFEFETFGTWHDACKARNAREMLLALEEFHLALATFDQKMKDQLINAAWFKNTPTDQDPIFQISSQGRRATFAPFKPFVEKRVIPIGSTVIFHADFHGDIDALRRYLREYIHLESDFKFKEATTYMVFLGDYTDRGACGAEVLYTLMRLKIANQHQVFLLRGNHEDMAMNIQPQYGFHGELKEKFGKPGTQNLQQLVGEIERFYNQLPVALFLGIENKPEKLITYLLCCHGGLEIGYDPNPILQWNTPEGYAWITKLYRSLGLSAFGITLPKIPDNLNELTTYNMGFMWSDFIVNPNKAFHYKEGRGFAYSKEVTEKMLASYKGIDTAGNYYAVAGIFRGHQHSQSLNEMMNNIFDNGGISKLWRDKAEKDQSVWNGIVCTFNVAPEIYGKPAEKFPGFNVDTHGILKTSEKPFDQWQLIAQPIEYPR